MRRFCLGLLALGLTVALVADEPRDEKDEPAVEATEKATLVLDAGGHTSTVTHVFFSPDNKTLYSTSADGTVRVWDVGTGESLRVLRLPLPRFRLRGFGGGIEGADLSQDGKLLAVGFPGHGRKENWVYLLDPKAGRVARVFKDPMGIIGSVAISPDKSLVAAGSAGLIRVWEAATGKVRRELAAQKGQIRCLAFSPDGKRLASGSVDHSVNIWEIETGKILATLSGHENWVTSVAWSRDGKWLVSGSLDRNIRLWKADGTFQEKLPSPADKGHQNGLAFSTNSKRLLTGTVLLNLANKKELARLSQPVPTACAALSHDGKLAACGGNEAEELLVWSTQDGSVVHRLGGDGRLINDVSWRQDGRAIAWRSPESGTKGKVRKQAPSRSFDFGELRLGPAADSGYLAARHNLGDRTLARESARCVVRRGKEKDRGLILKPGRGEVAPACFTFLGENRVVTGGMFGLDLFELPGGKVAPIRFKNPGFVKAVAPSPDNRFFVTGGPDQTLKIWSPERDRAVLQLFVAGNDWVAWTPEGYYAASPGGERLMGWQVNAQEGQLATFYPANRFRKSLYRPDVLKHVLDTGGVAKALEVANKESGRQTALVDVEQVLPPRVAILSPEQSGLEVKESKVTVKAVAESAGKHPITSMQLLLDDRPFQGQRGVRGAEPRTSKMEREWTVDLAPGTHRLSVLARSSVSTATSQAVEVTYTPPTAPSPADLRPNLFVLTVGINAYPGDLRLDCAVNDAQELKAVLAQKTSDLFRRVETRSVLDKEATRDGILKALGWLRGQMKSHDVAVVFYAGHGYRDKDGRFYLLSIDMDDANLEKTAVSGDELKRQLADLPGRVVLLLDACHSGAIGNRGKGGSITDDLARELSDDDCGVVVMCAAMGKEESLEKAEVKHGFFTLALIEGLSGKADYNKDGLIHLTELDLYVDNTVIELSKDKQHPVTAKPTTIRSFALTKP